MEEINKKKAKVVGPIPLPPVIIATGIKPAATVRDEYLRRVLFLIIIGLVIWSIYTDEDDDVDISDLEPNIKKDTILYKTIAEMDCEARNKYIKSLKKTFDDRPTMLKKYSNSVKIALIAGLCGEYIINGNIIKPAGIIAKTIIYALLATNLS